MRTSSMPAWLGGFIVLAIPLVNVIMLFVWGFSSGTNPSKQNFCRATLIVYLICFVPAEAYVALTGHT